MQFYLMGTIVGMFFVLYALLTAGPQSMGLYYMFLMGGIVGVISFVLYFMPFYRKSKGGYERMVSLYKSNVGYALLFIFLAFFLGIVVNIYLLFTIGNYPDRLFFSIFTLSIFANIVLISLYNIFAYVNGIKFKIRFLYSIFFTLIGLSILYILAKISGVDI